MTHHVTDHLTFGLRKKTRFSIHAIAKNKPFHKSSQTQDGTGAQVTLMGSEPESQNHKLD